MLSTSITLNVTLARLPGQAFLGRQAGQRHPRATERHLRRLPPPPNVTLPGSWPLSGPTPVKGARLDRVMISSSAPAATGRGDSTAVGTWRAVGSTSSARPPAIAATLRPPGPTGARAEERA
jgi:hypothetical protein